MSKVMGGNGPASPDLREMSLILASDNTVALDAVMATMMGCEPGQLIFLRKAREAGLAGELILRHIETIGELKPLPDFKLPPLSGEAVFHNETIQGLINDRTLVRSQVNPDWYTGCGTCIEQCPVSALSMGDNLPQVDPEICITCFCCQEICPEKAISLR